MKINLLYTKFIAYQIKQIFSINEKKKFQKKLIKNTKFLCNQKFNLNKVSAIL